MHCGRLSTGTSENYILSLNTEATAPVGEQVTQRHQKQSTNSDALGFTVPNTRLSPSVF